jgi:hypothetical protein
MGRDKDADTEARERTRLACLVVHEEFTKVRTDYIGVFCRWSGVLRIGVSMLPRNSPSSRRSSQYCQSQHYTRRIMVEPRLGVDGKEDDT